MPFLFTYHGERATPLLRSMQSSLVEAAGYTALGLASAALSAQRKAVELAHYWLYFADQPLLWARAQEDGSGFVSREAIVKFLGDTFPLFRPRWQALEKTAARTTNPYAFLSKHIHAQAAGLLGKEPNIAGLIAPPEIMEDVCVLQTHVDEYLHDTFSARFVGSWPMLSATTRANLEGRLGADLAKLL